MSADAQHADRAREPKPLPDGRSAFIRLTDLVGRVIVQSLVNVKIEGLDQPLPTSGPLLIVSNHLSNADGVLLACWLTPALNRRIYLLGKQEALDWPLIGWGLANNAVIGIKRGASDLEGFRAARRVLDEGHVLGVFPEGTRSPTGGLQEAKDGIAILALRTGAPILPIGLANTDKFWPRGDRFHHGGTVALRVGKPFTVGATPAHGVADGPATGGDRRQAQHQATEEIMTRVAELLPPRHRGAYADLVRKRGSVGP